MSTQEVRTAEPADVVTVSLTPREVAYLLRRCAQARSVIQSNLALEEQTRRGTTFQSLQIEMLELNALMKKLTEAK